MIKIVKTEIKHLTGIGIRDAMGRLYDEAYEVCLTFEYNDATTTAGVYNWLVTHEQTSIMCINACENFMSQLPKEVSYEDISNCVIGTVLPRVYESLGLPVPGYWTQCVR